MGVKEILFCSRYLGRLTIEDLTLTIDPESGKIENTSFVWEKSAFVKYRRLPSTEIDIEFGKTTRSIVTH
jgi:hypothetical protein